MKNVGGTSEYIAFFDECGDHTLELIDNMGGELGDDGPALEQVVMKALYTIYET